MKKTKPEFFDEEKDKQLRALCRMKPTGEDCAAFLGCSLDTIERYLRKKYNKTFAEFRNENMVHTRFSLIRKAIQKAENGDNVMLIFCLKNLCGWSDKQEVESTNTEIKLAYNVNSESN